MAKEFARLYFGIFLALVIVTAFKVFGDPETGSVSEVVSNLYERREIVLALFLGAPLVLALFLVSFQKLLSKFKKNRNARRRTQKKRRCRGSPRCARRWSWA